MEDNSALWSALMSRDQNGGMWNNPFMYLIWLALFQRNGGGLFGGCNGNAVADLANQASDNQNFGNLADTVRGAAGFSTEKTINASILGDKDIQSKLAECCCNTQQGILRMGYENQLANERQTGVLHSRIDQLASGIQTGFASVGYETQRQTCDIINNANANTQRIVDVMNNHWNQDLRDKLFEMSQNAQTASIVNQLKTT